MIQLLYISLATWPMQEDDLIFLLQQARDRNQQQNVTGMLLYRDGTFVQLLEGESSDVEEIYQAIILDERNTGNYLIDKSEIKQRRFPSWNMGFKDLTKIPADELEGFSDIFINPQSYDSATNNKTSLVRLLSKF